jgi:hypothetical protein
LYDEIRMIREALETQAALMLENQSRVAGIPLNVEETNRIAGILARFAGSGTGEESPAGNAETS